MTVLGGRPVRPPAMERGERSGLRGNSGAKPRLLCGREPAGGYPHPWLRLSSVAAGGQHRREGVRAPKTWAAGLATMDTVPTDDCEHERHAAIPEAGHGR